MFLAWRDMRSARGRFALITGVVLLMTLLIGLLSGLTGGLAQQNISEVRALDGDRVVLADETFDESELTDSQVEAWRDSELVADVRSGSSGSRSTGRTPRQRASPPRCSAAPPTPPLATDRCG